MSKWQKRAVQLIEEGIENRAFIDGKYQDASNKATFSSINPSTESHITEITLCGVVEVNQSIISAKKAFDSGVWANIAPKERAKILKKLADLVEEDAENLAILESIDMGMPVLNALSDVFTVAHCIRWFAETIDKIGGEIPPVDPDYLGLITREPVGIVAAIVPWNFPLLMTSWKIAPALASGNCVILKPSEKASLTGIKLAQLAQKAGIPRGVFQVLTGDGSVGKLLASHMGVDCVAFTGSTAVGKLIALYAAESNLKRVWLELGGKSANIIFADCPDISKAAQSAANAIYYNSGQMCSAGSRVLIERSVKDEFLKEFSLAAAQFQPQLSLDESCNLGPIVDQKQYSRILEFIEIGKKEATLLCGGSSKKIDGKGYFVEPTAFIVNSPDSVIAKEEIFGPVLSIIIFDTEDEAIEIANNTPYGLGAGVWTSNISRAHLLSRRLRSGTVWVNCYEEGEDMNMPFGGFKQSGNGRDKSLHSLEKYTEIKSTLIRLR